MPDDITLARFDGPLHGVVLRRKPSGSCYTRCFNVRPDLGYIGSEYQGHYDMTLDGGLLDFVARVQRTLNSAPGDLRKRDRKDSIPVSVLTDLDCKLTFSAELRELLRLEEEG